MKKIYKLLITIVFVCIFLILKTDKANAFEYTRSTAGSFQLEDGAQIKFNAHEYYLDYMLTSVWGKVTYTKGDSWLKVNITDFVYNWPNPEGYETYFSQGPCVAWSADMYEVCHRYPYPYNSIAFIFNDSGPKGFKQGDGDFVEIYSGINGGYVTKGNIQVHNPNPNIFQ